MPRRRTKTRLDHLADALAAAHLAGAALNEIDLRQTQGDLRDSVRKARNETEALRALIEKAILTDRPKPPVPTTR